MDSGGSDGWSAGGRLVGGMAEVVGKMCKGKEKEERKIGKKKEKEREKEE